ncbi:MotA/TolQ/ExbB proton channel family protein [bacterium]|nr:MAG: MotA/TolQ/ExbB proton channel family protein [bacterium]
MFQNLGFFGLIQKGGVTVFVLMFFSLVSVAVMLERARAFIKYRRLLSASYNVLSAGLGSGGLKTLEGLCKREASPLARVVLEGILRAHMGKEEVLRGMELAGRVEIGRLEKFLGVLGTIGSTAPFVGLFGTVVGIIRAFSDLAGSQGVSPAAVADGIAEALVATAAGLVVAIPAVIAYNYFVRSVQANALLLEAKSAVFTDAILDAADTMRDKDGLEL